MTGQPPEPADQQPPSPWGPAASSPPYAAAPPPQADAQGPWAPAGGAPSAYPPPAYPPSAYPPAAYPPSAYPAAPGMPAAGSPWMAPPAGPYAGAAYPPLASWGQRVLAYLLDVVFQLPAVLLYFAGFVILVVNSPTTTSSGRILNAGNPAGMWLGGGLAILGVVGMLVLGLYNHVFRQGRTGQTWGKSRIGLRLQAQDTGAIIGAGNTFLRQLLHVLDGVAYVGYLWPLWDPMRQTFADKIMRTVVVQVH
jgi:uncharacterized RDD family membrane protein YckC